MCPFTVRLINTWSLAGFLGSLITYIIRATEVLRYYRKSPIRTYFTIQIIANYFNHLFRQVAVVSLLRHCIAVLISTGILTCFSSVSPVGYTLETDLPPGDWHCRGILDLSACGVLTRIIVTYAYICFSIGSSLTHDRPSTHIECSPTNVRFVHSIASVICLCPRIIHAEPLD